MFCHTDNTDCKIPLKIQQFVLYVYLKGTTEKKITRAALCCKSFAFSSSSEERKVLKSSCYFQNRNVAS